MPQLQVTIAQNSVPQQVASTNIYFRTATFFGITGFTPSGTPVSNTSNIYYGPKSGAMPMVATAGSSSSYEVVSRDEKLNLQNYWAVGKSGDGLYIIYN